MKRWWWPWRREHKATAPHVSQVWMADAVLNATTNQLRAFCSDAQAHEGIVYWAGVEAAAAWHILTAIRPQAITTWGSYHTTAVDNALVIRDLRPYRIHVLAQVHSHPGSWVDHSPGDIDGAFMPFNGFLSIVVPNYAAQGMLPLTRCAVHRYERGRFRRLADDEVGTLFRIVPGEITYSG